MLCRSNVLRAPAASLVGMGRMRDSRPLPRISGCRVAVSGSTVLLRLGYIDSSVYGSVNLHGLHIAVYCMSRALLFTYDFLLQFWNSLPGYENFVSPSTPYQSMTNT